MNIKRTKSKYTKTLIIALEPITK